MCRGVECGSTLSYREKRDSDAPSSVFSMFFRESGYTQGVHSLVPNTQTKWEGFPFSQAPAPDNKHTRLVILNGFSKSITAVI